MSEIRDFILSEISENLNFLEPEYDCCIVDVSTDSCHVIYDWNKMIEHRMKTYGETNDEAVEFLDFNYIGWGTRNYGKENYPIIIGDNLWILDFVNGGDSVSKEDVKVEEEIEVKIYNKKTGVEVELSEEELSNLKYFLEYFADADLSLLENGTIESLQTIMKLLNCNESLLRSVQWYLEQRTVINK